MIELWQLFTTTLILAVLGGLILYKIAERFPALYIVAEGVYWVYLRARSVPWWGWALVALVVIEGYAVFNPNCCLPGSVDGAPPPPDHY